MKLSSYQNGYGSLPTPSELPPHRKVLEPKNPDIQKDTGIFSIKNLKTAEKLVYIVKGKNVSRNLNYSEKRVDTCLILW